MKSTRKERPAGKQRPTASRKKSCLQCAKSKVRCGLERPCCARCVAANRQCKYAIPAEDSDHSSPIVSRPSVPPHHSVATPASLSTAFTDDLTNVTLVGPTAGTRPTATLPLTIQTPTAASSSGMVSLDFSKLDLVPLDSAEQIRDRWLRPFLNSGEQQTPKAFHPYTLQYISCVLRTYPKLMIMEDGVPPIIHPMQVFNRKGSAALANCFSLVRLWHHSAVGSEDIVAETIQREMERLAANYDTNADDLDVLGAFQAYLIYSIIAILLPIQGHHVVNDATMMTLHEMAFRTAQTGLVSQAELARSRPGWESWILVSAKRRAIFAFYLLASVYNADNYVPNFLAEELREVYVPDTKRLWEARDRNKWEREYNRYLSEWEDGGLMMISELWQSPETGSAKRRERVDRWVQSADEFGMMLFAVCAHLHGC